MDNHSVSAIKHTLLTRLLHHGSAVLIVLLWVLVEFREELGMVGIKAMSLHKSFGVMFLLWVIARIINALLRPKIAIVPAPKWQTALAHLTHAGLYVCMLAMPICGILLLQYDGYPVSFFGFELPMFVAPDSRLVHTFEELHTDIVFSVLIALVVAHIAAAIYHLSLIHI